ncbi:MAG: SMC-Scp complex subunit ScpB [Candidatus Acidiferrales bacterium]
MSEQELMSTLEAIIYAADEPATIDQMVAAIGGEKSEVRAALDKLVASYGAEERGIEIRKVAGGWKMYTKAQHHEAVRKFIKSLRPALRLTMPALETLSVIAYKQPATLPEINEVRGVNCGGVIKTLLERRLITTAGRKDAVGRPILYRTSKDFLMRFGLADLDELPSLKEFEQLAQAALGADDGIAPTEPEEGPDEAPEEASGEEQGILSSANPEAAEASAQSDANAAEAVDSDLPAEMASPSAEAILDTAEHELHADETAPLATENAAEGTTAANSEATTPDNSPPEKKAATSRG